MGLRSKPDLVTLFFGNIHGSIGLAQQFYTGMGMVGVTSTTNTHRKLYFSIIVEY
jgi:hypothetical protein